MQVLVLLCFLNTEVNFHMNFKKKRMPVFIDLWNYEELNSMALGRNLKKKKNHFVLNSLPFFLYTLISLVL